ncbi:MAG: UbiD family decarboxylase [Chloroflexi bacterium]|nr:UbiD family decarboxylase [Chloroflexota bacterium]
MPFNDLREFLNVLEREGELARVPVEVALDFEVGAVCRKTLDRNGPALLFERPGSYSTPLAVNAMGTRRRYALALGVEPQEIHDEWIRRTKNPIKPVLVSSGPCKENILLGDDVDIFKFPIPVWNALDGGPFITFASHFTRDPETGERNVGLYRCQVHDKRTIGILAAPMKHIGLQRGKALERGERFYVASAIGLDPAVQIGATASFPFGVDEMEMAGALRGAPVEMVKCETVPLEVPASAEIVIEGEILPDVLVEEGPFGEFTGYYGLRGPRPVIRISAITYRNGAIHQASYVGMPPQESNVMQGIPIEAEIKRLVPLPGIKEVHITDGGCGGFNAIVSIDKRFEGYGKWIGMAIMGTTGSRFIKNLILVDTDVDVRDWSKVEWALATRVQPHRDVEIIKDVTGSYLDPSIPKEERLTANARTSKMIIDATKKDAKEFEDVCVPKADVMAKVEEDWSKYGIP